MIFEELMHKYLDGTLSDPDQTELFHIVSVSPEKRVEFNEYVSMRSAMVKDRMSQTVPVGLEQAVLAAATAPALLNEAGIKGKESAVGIMAGLSRFSTALLVTGGLLASGVIGYLIGRQNYTMETVAVNNPPAITGAPAIVQHSEESPLKPARSAVAHGSSTGTSLIGHTFHRKAAYASTSLTDRSVTEGSSVTGSDAESEQFRAPVIQQNTIEKLLATANIPVVHTVPILIVSQGSDHVSGLMQRDAALTHDMDTQQPNEETEEGAQYQLELQEGGGLMFPNLSSSNLNTAPLINNTALRVGMQAWDGAMLGISVGQSMFGLRYTSQPDALTTVTYMQYSNLWYTGLYLQQSLDPLIGLTPRVTLELAATNIGALGNLQAGISYPISRSVYASVNGIVSDFMYRHSGVWLNSQKIGLMFGIGTEF